MAEKLKAEMTRWGQKSYAELAALTYPQVYEVGTTGEPDWYKVEVRRLENSEYRVQVSVAVSDGGLSSDSPKAARFFAYRLPPDSQLERLARAVMAGLPEEIVRAVADGADVNERDDGGETVLTRATSIDLGPERSLACVRCLLGLGARVSEERPQIGALNMGTSVHQAADNGYTQALKALLAADGRVALNAFDDMGRTPLIRAVQRGNFEEVLMLLDAGSDINAHEDATRGDTALARAVDEKNLPMVELLLKHGADPSIEGWMRLTAVDHAQDLVEEDTAPDLRRILELLKEETERRRVPAGKPSR